MYNFKCDSVFYKEIQAIHNALYGNMLCILIRNGVESYDVEIG